MNQHPIPQNVTQYQFRLIGDMTIKQFIGIAAGILLAIITYNLPLLPALFKWPIAIMFAFGGAAVAFVPINDRPMSEWIFNFAKAIYAPTHFTWKKTAIIPDYMTYKAQHTASTLPPLPKKTDSKHLSSYVDSLQNQGQQQNEFDKLEDNKLESIDTLFKQTTSGMPTPAPSPIPNMSDNKPAGNAPRMMKAAPSAQQINSTVAQQQEQSQKQPSLSTQPPVIPLITPDLPLTTMTPQTTTPLAPQNPTTIASSAPLAPDLPPTIAPQTTTLAPNLPTTMSQPAATTPTPQLTSIQSDPLTTPAIPQASIPVPPSDPLTPTAIPPASIPAPPPNNQNQMTSIRGNILIDGAPATSAIVEILDKVDQVIRTTKTDPQGVFTFPIPIKLGEYKVRCEHPQGQFPITNLSATNPQTPILTITGKKINSQPAHQQQSAIPQSLKTQPSPLPTAQAPVSAKPSGQPAITQSSAAGPIITKATPISPPIKVESANTPPQTQTITKTKQITSVEMPLAPETSNTLVGMTFSNNDQLLSNVIIEVLDKNNFPVRTVKSNNLGQFFIATPLNEGSYTVKAGHKEHKFNPIKIQATGSIIPPIKLVSIK